MSRRARIIVVEGDVTITTNQGNRLFVTNLGDGVVTIKVKDGETISIPYCLEYKI